MAGGADRTITAFVVPPAGGTVFVVRSAASAPAEAAVFVPKLPATADEALERDRQSRMAEEGACESDNEDAAASVCAVFIQLLPSFGATSKSALQAEAKRLFALWVPGGGGGSYTARAGVSVSTAPVRAELNVRDQAAAGMVAFAHAAL